MAPFLQVTETADTVSVDMYRSLYKALHFKQCSIFLTIMQLERSNACKLGLLFLFSVQLNSVHFVINMRLILELRTLL